MRDLSPNEAAAPIDWSSWYLTDEDDEGQTVEQSSILWELLSALRQWVAERGWKDVLCSGDNFFAWVESEPLVRVSPDAYLLDEPPPAPRPKFWQTWLPGHKPPRWAVEVVSEDWKKDYDDNPPKYAQLGARELVIFDPEALAADESSRRVPLQVYRRGDDGAFVRAYRGKGPAFCEEIDAHLVIVNEGGAPRLRIARDAAGTDLVPTAEQRAQREASRAQQEARRAQQEARRAQEEADARRAAEEKVRALEAELARLRGG
ncbi:MAG: Uma2 family endonuclease [Polyangiaceae bacterium]